MEIRFRPHHFLCTLCFEGKGYSSAFISNYQTIVDKLNSKEGDNQIIEIVSQTDDICSPCPHRQLTQCESQEKIDKLDHAHAKALHVQAGEKISWRDAKEKIKQFITLDVFHDICHECDWKNLGICETRLTNFLNEEK